MIGSYYSRLLSNSTSGIGGFGCVMMIPLFLMGLYSMPYSNNRIKLSEKREDNRERSALRGERYYYCDAYGEG